LHSIQRPPHHPHHHQACFFTFFDLATHQGFFWMGITVVVLSATLLLVHFPQW
jgi:hypothetical protein